MYGGGFVLSFRRFVLGVGFGRRPNFFAEGVGIPFPGQLSRAHGI